jgi:hypothetical protein
MSESRHLISYQNGVKGLADFRGGLGITKKEFFITSKMTVFLQILQFAEKRRCRSMNMGVW